PPPSWFLQVQLLLHLQAEPAFARELGRRYAAWVREEGLQDAFKSDETARVWPLLAQLQALPDGFDPALRSGLAHALLDGALDPVRDAFEALRERSPEGASEAVGLLRAHAPGLEGFLKSPLLRPPESPRPTVLTVLWNAVRSPQGRGVSSGVFILLFFLLKAVFLPSVREHRSTERPVVVEARRLATRLCSQLEIQDGERLCGTLQQLVVWGASGRCSKVLSEQAEVERQLEAQVAALGADAGLLQEAQRQRLKSAREEFRRALLNVCQG
ncbi:hypothetical protein, partial [Corallococcus sp. CA047B]|uniref:hypothetical protein n=1 Tax=Corallococcus sp. CA047B TaxID=2316729 RepID=UPI00131524B3